MKKSERNDSNFNPGLVLYEGKEYETGNRYHNLIELFNGREFFKTVEMSNVEPIKLKIMNEEDFIQLNKTVFPTKEKTISVNNDPLYKGAHRYSIQNCIGFKEGKTRYVDSRLVIQFIEKRDDGTIIAGVQDQQVLIMLIDRLKKLNDRFSCRQNSLAITKLEEALMWLDNRVQERIEREVMGELKK